MAKLILQVESTGLSQTIKGVESLRSELQRLTGIKYDGTNSQAIADALLRREEDIAAKRAKVQADLQDKLKLIEAKGAIDAKIQAEKRVSTEEIVNRKIEAQKAISQERINAQNERFYAKEARLQENQANSLFSKFGNVRNVLGSITQAAIAAGAAITASLSVTNFINLNKALDSTRARIKGLFSGNDSGLNEFDATVRQVTNNSALSFKAVQEAATNLKTLGLEPTVSTLQALVDATAKVGGSNEVLDGIVRALTQSLNKGKIQQEELNQLSERGIPAQRLLAEAMGITGAELVNLQKNGKLGRNEVELLISAIGKFSAGASAQQIDTIGGSFTKLTDSVQSAARQLGESGVNKALADIAKSITQTVSEAEKTGQLKQIGTDIANGLRAGFEAIKSFSSIIKENISTIKLLGEAFILTKAIGVFTSGITSVIGIFGKLGGAATSTAKIVGTVSTSIIGLGGIFSKLPAFASAFNPLSLAITATAGAIAFFNSKMDEFKAKQEQSERTATIANRLKEISEATGITVKTMDELNAKMDAGAIIMDAATGKYANAVVVLNELNASSANADFSRYAELSSKADSALESIKGLMDGGITGAIRMEDALARVSNIELANLKTAFTDALDTGIIKSDEFSNALNLINIEGINRQFEILGVKSSAELQRVATEAKAAFDAIANSGASVRDVALAFESYAEKAIAANKQANPEKAGVLESQLKVLAAQNKLNAEIDTTGQVSARSFGDLISSADNAASKIREVDTLQQQLNVNLQRHMQDALNNDIAFQNQLDNVFKENPGKQKAIEDSQREEADITNATKQRLNALLEESKTKIDTTPQPVVPSAPFQAPFSPGRADNTTATIVINIDGKKILEEIRTIALQRK